jgi:hypothetical protein
MQQILRKRKVWLTIATVAVLSLVVLGCFYRRFLLSGLDLVAEATGGRISAALALALGLLALVWVFVWMAFPIFVYFGLRDLRRRTAQLDRTTTLCARNLSRIAAEQHGAKTHDVPDEQAEG